MPSWNHSIIVVPEITAQYLDIKKERKSKFFTASNIEKKKLAVVYCMILTSQLSLNVFVIWKLNISYNIQIFVMGNRFYSLYTQCRQWDDSAFCVLALIVIQTVFLQLKIIPCDSTSTWHTSSILCNSWYTWTKHKYHQQASSGSIRFYQYNAQL